MTLLCLCWLKLGKLKDNVRNGQYEINQTVLLKVKRSIMPMMESLHNFWFQHGWGASWLRDNTTSLICYRYSQSIQYFGLETSTETINWGTQAYVTRLFKKDLRTTSCEFVKKTELM